MYPINLELENTLGDGYILTGYNGNILIETYGAINLKIKVNRSDYPIEEVRKAIKEICEKAVEHYG